MSERRINLKRRFPFRLGTTSYIIPADIITNVKVLAPRVDDIELVLFESDEISNLPEAQEIPKLRTIATENDLTYTVHLPIDIQLGVTRRDERCRSVDKCLRVIAQMRSLAVRALIVHFHEIPTARWSLADAENWQASLSKSVKDLLNGGVDPRTLCVENLDYPFEMVEDVVRDHDLSLCLDIGHVSRYGYPFEEYLDRYLARSRVVHLHGVIEGRDHGDISVIANDRIASLLARLDDPSAGERVLTLEMFNEGDLEQSLAVLQRFVKCDR